MPTQTVPHRAQTTAAHLRIIRSRQQVVSSGCQEVETNSIGTDMCGALEPSKEKRSTTQFALSHLVDTRKNGTAAAIAVMAELVTQPVRHAREVP